MCYYDYEKEIADNFLTRKLTKLIPAIWRNEIENSQNHPNLKLDKPNLCYDRVIIMIAFGLVLHMKVMDELIFQFS